MPKNALILGKSSKKIGQMRYFFVKILNHGGLALNAFYD